MENNAEKLLPCPFCGGANIERYGDLLDGYGYQCTKCYGSVGPYEGTRGTYEITATEIAKKAWNARAAVAVDAPLPAVGIEDDEPCALCGAKCDSFSANPSMWPLTFCPPDGSGKTRQHHVKCVTPLVYASGKLENVEGFATIQDAVDSRNYWRDMAHQLQDEITAAQANAPQMGEASGFRYVEHAHELISNYTGDDRDVINAHGLLDNALAEIQSALRAGVDAKEVVRKALENADKALYCLNIHESAPERWQIKEALALLSQAQGDK